MCDYSFMELFRRYLKSTGTSLTKIAGQLNSSKGCVHDLLSGRRRPSLRLAYRIEEVTDGAVPMTSWFAEHAHTPSAPDTEDAA